MSAAAFIARNYYNALAATLCQRSIFFSSLAVMILVWSQAASIKASSVGDAGCFPCSNMRINGDFISLFYGRVCLFDRAPLVNPAVSDSDSVPVGPTGSANEEEMARRLEGSQMHLR